ncbi:hypothetical protein T484DRAFT_3263882 [Baffinella frigidus]|nr:hypothetical protein T484DRAFT_3263882 [Cryptophyta sp. CCMP2293]
MRWQASLRMAHAAECGLGAAFKGGVVVAQPSPEAEEYGSGPDKRLASEVHTGAAGNLPDAAAEAGARRVLLLAQEAGEGEVLLVLISGGGSALLPLPAPPVTLLEKLAATKALVQAGASISQLNTVRKHLSAVKGGRLAAAAYPARVVALILSDVIGDPLDVIASGPTVPDTTTFGDALSVVDRLGARDKLPPTVLAHLLAGAAGEGGVSETPKVGDERLSRARSIIVGSNRIAALRATEIAGAAGFDARVHTLCLQGDTASAASLVSAMARGFLAAEPRKRVCVVLAGETTARPPREGD